MSTKRPRKPYTEIRIEHDTLEEKEQFEKIFDSAIKEKGYKSRIEYLREQIRKLTKGLK
jgi:metal-responsive CopG/Arc/MetJ family transcriptional regulator